MRVRELFAGMYPIYRNSPQTVLKREVNSITQDAFAADEASVFVASKTALHDGQLLIRCAYENGCRVFVARHDPILPADALVYLSRDVEAVAARLSAVLYKRKTGKMRVVGIVGSVGKTTTLLMAQAYLRACGRRVGAITPHGVWFEGFAIEHFEILPNAPQIHYMIGLLEKYGCEILLLEINSYQAEHRAFDAVPFAGIVLTALCYADIEAGVHRTERDYIEATLHLFRSSLPHAYLPDALRGLLKDRPVAYYGGQALLRAEPCARKAGDPPVGSRLRLVEDGEEYDVFLPVAGDIAIKDLLAACAVCRIVGERISNFYTEIEGFRPIGTLELLGRSAGALIFRDSAFLPRRVRAAIHTLRPLASGRLIVLLGSVGGRAYERRVALAGAVTDADLVILTADDPNFEDPAAISGTMAAALPKDLSRYCIADREKALAFAVGQLKQGDLLLLFGKGLFPAQHICGARRVFDEKALLFPETAQKTSSDELFSLSS